MDSPTATRDRNVEWDHLIELDEGRQNLDEQKIAAYKRLEAQLLAELAQLLAELEQVQSRLTALGLAIAEPGSRVTN